MCCSGTGPRDRRRATAPPRGDAGVAGGLPGSAQPVPAAAGGRELAGHRAGPRAGRQLAPAAGAAARAGNAAGWSGCWTGCEDSMAAAGRNAGWPAAPMRPEPRGGSWPAPGCTGGPGIVPGGWPRWLGPITAVCADVVRPSLRWLVAGGRDTASWSAPWPRFRDPEGSRGCGRCATPIPPCRAAGRHTLRRAAVILAAKGGTLDGITIGDLLELLDTEAEVHGAPRADARPATGCCASRGSSARQRRRGCASCAPRASARPRS